MKATLKITGIALTIEGVSLPSQGLSHEAALDASARLLAGLFSPPCQSSASSTLEPVHEQGAGAPGQEPRATPAHRQSTEGFRSAVRAGESVSRRPSRNAGKLGGDRNQKGGRK